MFITPIFIVVKFENQSHWSFNWKKINSSYEEMIKTGVHKILLYLVLREILYLKCVEI